MLVFKYINQSYIRIVPVRLLLLTLCLAFTPNPALATEPAPLPDTPETWLRKMLDAKTNGAAFKDPAAFAEWLDAITEPRFMTALAATASDPATYPKILADAIDPAAARNWAEFTDPQLYLRWMLSSATPSFQQAIVKKMTDPAKFKRWLETASQPGAYTSMMSAFSAAPTAWLRASGNPASYSPAARLLQPATPLSWLGAMTDEMARHMADKDWVRLPERTPGPVKPSASGPFIRY